MRLALASALVVAGLTAGAAPAQRGALPRATADRPDDVRGPQLHLVYAVPADGEDRALDTSGAVASSVASWNGWLATESGRPGFRIDTSSGEPDVTFVRLPRTDGQIAALGAFVRDELERLLGQAGLLVGDKVYAVYYDGSSTYSCGGGAWPPTLPGRVAAMYLRGAPPGASRCDTNRLAGPGEPPGYLDIAMLHEVVHTLGFVAPCAPNHTRAGHVSDSPNDLMWAGDAPWQLPPRLDIGRNDYYGHGRADCPDLATSPYLADVQPPAPPPAPAAGLRITGFRTSAARSGHPFSAYLTIRRGATLPVSASVSCSARVGSRSLAAVRRYSAGVATCTWRLPVGAAGRRLTGSIAAMSRGSEVRRSFTRRVG